MNNSDAGVAMNLEVEMRRVESVSVPNQADFLAASNRLTLSHKDFIKMCVQRISVLKLAAFVKRVTNHNYIAPRTFEISG